MSAKILSSLTDENPNLQKQIGCMNGIFQLFDRRHFLNGRRQHSHNRKELLTGPSHNTEPKGAKPGRMERNGKELQNEKQRNSTESSRTSTSSSFSSFDHSTPARQEPTPSSQHSSSETQPQTKVKQQNSSLPLGRQSIDLRDVVKDSMYREARGLSIKTVAKEEGRSHVMKHIDSPRPIQQPKSGQPRVAGVDGSIRAKQREAQCSYKEQKESSFQLRPKDPPRFSYDSRELRDATKSSIRLKELPRLSLDSRDTRTSASGLRANTLLILGQEQSSHKRSSSVIAKLMGLEALPDYAPSDQAKPTIPDEYLASRSSHATEEGRQNQVPLSPRVLQKGPASPRPSQTSLVKKPTSSARYPLEKAPWMQSDSTRGSHNLVVKSREVSVDAPHASSTVYGEIEKRITDLEFKRSGKDLRALKQILEAMQKTRQKLENQNVEEADIESQTSRCTSEYSSCPQDSKSPMLNQQNNHQVSTIRGSSHSKMPESSIIIMKPVKFLDKFGNSSSATDVSHVQKLRTQDAKCKRVDSMNKQIHGDKLQRNNNLQDPSRRFPSLDKKNKEKIAKAVHISREIKQMRGEYCTSPARSSGTVSPRSQQHKRDIDRQNQPTTLSSDSGRARLQPNKINADSGSPNRKLRVKSANIQRGDGQRSKINSETRNCYHQDDSASLLSESNNSLASEVTSTDRSKNGSTRQDHTLRFEDNMPIAVLEQPSPVSVLDAAYYGEDSPSPVKKISTHFTDDESLDAEEPEWHAENLDHWQKIRRPNMGFEFTHDKLENMEDLVNKLKLLLPLPDEATVDYITSLCGSSNPDHQYITKVLLASGILKNESSISTPIQLHSSGQLLNPDLFHVLERTEQRTQLLEEEVNGKAIELKSNQKIHRRILFDTVNEILVRKLSSENTLQRRRNRRGQELLKELFLDVDLLQTISNCSLNDDEDQLDSIVEADMTRHMEDWSAYDDEMPALVLDIERLLFKDLISEIINEEIAGDENWPRRLSRQLFTK